MLNLYQRCQKSCIRHRTLLLFTGRTIFYFLIILALVYLYQYCGVGNSKFIYNEF